MKILAIANNKGGCGKTATSLYLGRLLADAGLRTLLIDLDPQANLTQQSGVMVGKATIADVLSGAPGAPTIRDALIYVDCEKPAHAQSPFYLCPSEFQLANVSLGLLNDAVRGRTALRRALREIKAGFDIVIIDCPPEAGILLANALLAADGVICPAEPEQAAIDGVRRVVQVVDHIRTEYERDHPEVLGVVATRVHALAGRHREGIGIMESSILAPLLGCIPERNGASRESDLREAYRPIAERVALWARGEMRDAGPILN